MDTPPRPTVSMEDLARMAGVSKMTVSLALRNHPNVSAARRQQIHDLAEQHGYVVDPELSSLARAIRRRSEKEPPTIAVLEFNEPEEAGHFANYVLRNRQYLYEEARRRMPRAMRMRRNWRGLILSRPIWNSCSR